MNQSFAPLFPLPNLVLYPRLGQPLHVFEPRYRQMTADALASDRMMALVLLRPGWEANYNGKPAIHSVACLGKIHSEEVLPDGRFNFYLRGLDRIRILEELESDKLYRSARVEVLPDVDLPSAAVALKLRERLLGLVSAWTADQASHATLTQMVQSDVPLGVVSDVLAFALRLPIEFKQELLESPEVARRALRLADFLEGNPPVSPSSGERRFPTEFSEN